MLLYCLDFPCSILHALSGLVSDTTSLGEHIHTSPVRLCCISVRCGSPGLLCYFHQSNNLAHCTSSHSVSAPGWQPPSSASTLLCNLHLLIHILSCCLDPTTPGAAVLSLFTPVGVHLTFFKVTNYRILRSPLLTTNWAFTSVQLARKQTLRKVGLFHPSLMPQPP